LTLDELNQQESKCLDLTVEKNYSIKGEFFGGFPDR